MALIERSFSRDLVGTHADRLGVNKDDAWANMEEFAELVGIVENDGNLQGKNQKSTAKGLYGFIDGSIDEAVKRTTKYIPETAWMQEVMDHRDANKLDKEQQTLLFLGNILEKNAMVDGESVPGLGDEILSKVMQKGDRKAMKLAYEILHHTKPDEATIRRMNKIFGDY